MMNGRFYGNYSMGMGYSPSNNEVRNPTFGGNTSFMYASGSRQGGYYYSPSTNYTAKKSSGHYLGNGQYVEN